MFIFLILVKDVIILSILISIFKFCRGKIIVHRLFHMPDFDTGSAFGIPWKPIWIRQNYVDPSPTRSGSTTLDYILEN